MRLKQSLKIGFAIKGGNQELLAMYLDKTPATISKYVSGKIDPPFSAILSMCEYFKVAVSEFAGWGETK